MDNKALNIFVTLAETLHFRKTSQLYNMTPSTLSRIIQRLEEEVGCVLFLRDNKEVTITSHGQEFYQFAKESLAKWEVLQNTLHADSPEKLHGSITIECTVTIAYGVLPNIIKDFLKKYPNIIPHIATGSPGRSMKRLLNSEVDFIIQPISENQYPDTIHKVIHNSKMVLLCPVDLPKPYVLQDIASQPIILSKYPALSKIVEGVFKEHGLKPIIHSYIDGNEAMLAMVAAGLGCAILPGVVIENSHLHQSIHVVHIDDLPVVEAAIFMKNQKYYSPVKAAFWEFIQENVHI